MQLDPEDPLVQAATLGKLVDDFMSGPIGRYVIDLAKEEELAAVNNLRTVDAEDPKLVRKYQNDALVAGKVIEWLTLAVHQGNMAMDKLKEDYGN